MAQPYRIVLQPADCQGAVFADKWVGTAYQFYGVKECSEPAGNLDEKSFVRRMFSDASSGVSQFFTYEFEQHFATMQKYIHLLTGKSGDTEIAVFCPTTFYRLGGDLQPTIQAGYPLRDLCEFDVLDELLIADQALTTKRYKALVVFQADIVDQPILDKIDSFLRAGGKVIAVGDVLIHNLEGKSWRGNRALKRVALSAKKKEWLLELRKHIAGYKGVDGEIDGLWTCRRGGQTFIFNSTARPVEKDIAGTPTTIEPYTIWDSEAARARN
jgi:hypothetical protein